MTRLTKITATETAGTTAPTLTRTQENKLRARLEKDSDAAIAHIADISRQMDSFLESRRDTSTDDESDPEGPTLAFERAQAHSILQQAKAHAAEITAALGRIESGDYGTCARCGSAIGFARLEARPSPPHCIRCAS
jgi:RNA polymerase-binding transcription factor DksA